METPPNKPSRLKKFFRWSLFIVIFLVTAGALFFAEEDWRGSRAWSQYQREMKAKGGSLDPAKLIPPKVPDDQNLAMIPFFTKNQPIELPENVSRSKRAGWPFGMPNDLTNWASAYGSPTADPVQAAKTVLEAMNNQEPLIADSKEAEQRPSCRFNIDYENWSGNTNVQMAVVQQFTQIKRLFRVLFLRAEAELVAGHSDQALDDIEVMFRANEGLRNEPLIISQLVGYATAEILLQPVAEGLAEHLWSDAQLQILQDHLREIDLLTSTHRAFEGERDFCVNPFFNGMGIQPRGWDRLEQFNFNRALDDMIMPRINLASRRIDPSVNRACNVAGSNLVHQAYFHHRVLAAMTLPGYEKLSIKTATVQTDVDQVAVACALERYRLAEGHYPETLEALTPKYSKALPHDIITGQPLKYRRTEEGTFILYSVGWNETDDGGKIVIDKDGRQDKLRGDWVFQYPR